MGSVNIFDATKSAGHGRCREPKFEPQPCTVPIEAQPGTPDKIAAMRLRAELGVDLWHDDDPNVRPDMYQGSVTRLADITTIHVDQIYDREQF